MGQWQPLPLITQSYESADDVEVSDLQATIMDLIPVQVGKEIHLWKRFGLPEFVDLGTGQPVDGLYWFDKFQTALAVSGGRVFKITDALGTTEELLGSTDLLSNSPVTFAKDATRVVMANGGRMVYTDLSTLTTMADADAPVNVTHVADLDLYVLANERGSSRIHFCDVNDLTTWQALSFFSAESKPDDVLAMAEGFNELLLLGSESVEFWVNDGQNPFSRIQGSAQPFGTSSPYSLALVGSTWMWLDHKRRLVSMQGRQVVPISSPYDSVIQNYSAVTNAIGYTVDVLGIPIYVLNFPTDGETIAYNVRDQQWHRWGYWNMDLARYDRFRGASYCYAKNWNMHLIGDHTNGKIYRASRQTFNDAGNPIRSLLRTGHIDQGVSFDKRSDIIRLKVKRGVATGTVPDPQIMMRRRVDNAAQWDGERWESLGKVGQHLPYIDWNRNGNYITEQLEFVHSDDTDLVMMGAQELVVGLGT